MNTYIRLAHAQIFSSSIARNNNFYYSDHSLESKKSFDQKPIIQGDQISTTRKRNVTKMKQVLISSLFGLSCLAMPMEEPAYLIGREAAPEPQKVSFSSNMASNIMANMNSMLSNLRIAAATTTTTSAAPTSTVPGSSDGSTNYITPIIAQHNNHRANHTVKDLSWDNGLASTAQTIAQSCVYAHNTTANGGGYGQNIGAGYYPSQVPAMLTNGMYNGEINYYPGYVYPNNGTGDPDMTNFSRWGHFSQIVWNSTTKVGCYTQYCPGGLANTPSNVRPYFTVCNYSPPGKSQPRPSWSNYTNIISGNYRNRFAMNVFAPKGNPTVVIPM